MKCSKQFATNYGTSHLPGNMIHVQPLTRNLTTPEGTPIVLLELQRHSGKQNTYLRIRMDVPETVALIAELQGAVASYADLVAAARGFYVDPKEWSLAPDPRYAENPPDDWEDCEQCGGLSPPGLHGRLPLRHQPLAVQRLR